MFHIRRILVLFIFFVSSCSIDFFDEIVYDNEIELDDDVDSPYYEIRKRENERVDSVLIQYAWGGNNEELYERLNIAFITDSHIDMGIDPKESLRNVKDAVDYCNNASVPISAIIHGGDAVTTIFSKKSRHLTHINTFFEQGWNADMPFLFTKGNHDVNSIRKPSSEVLSNVDWGIAWHDRAEKDYGIVRHILNNGDKSCYYYYDLDIWKVRIVCLDCYDVDYSKVDDNGNVLYWAGASDYIANEQFNWLANVALNFDNKNEKDWGVIVFTHYYQPANNDGTIVGPVYESIYPKINAMLKAFNNTSEYTEKYSFPEDSFFNLSISGNWTRYAELEKKPYLICVLSGHIHADDMNNIDGVHHITTANQFCGTEYSDIKIKRDVCTRTQNLFDILNIDLRERKLRIVRYGASANLDGQGGNRFLPEGMSF